MADMMKIRLYALAAVAIFVGLMMVYVRELDCLSNTIGLKPLLWGSLLVVASITAALLWRFRDRFVPLENHFPEVLCIAVFSLLFAPLWGSVLNRVVATKGSRTFLFISERTYFSSGYGWMRQESPKPTGWMLTVNDKGKVRQFRYKKQPYFPITQPGETIELPVVKGVFGVDIVDLR